MAAGTPGDRSDIPSWSGGNREGKAHAYFSTRRRRGLGTDIRNFWNLPLRMEYEIADLAEVSKFTWKARALQ